MQIPVLLAIIGVIILQFMLVSCGSIDPKPNYIPVPEAADPEKEFSMKRPDTNPVFAKKESLEKMQQDERAFEYQIGPGDILGLAVWRRPELSAERLIVSPDGYISAPRVGMIPVAGKTSEEVKDAITTTLEALYTKPEVTVQIHEFNNNKAYVLGNVNSPGMVRFTGKGTLLEGLSLAGGVPKEEQMTRCSIIRGNDQVIWIDLKDLLANGNMSLNTTIRNNDVIYVPSRTHDMVYIMGEVQSPGALQLHDGMSVLKAVMMAGGMMRTANAQKVFIIRQREVNGAVVEVNLEDLIANADFSQNYILIPDDIIFVSPTGMAKFNYSLDNIVPSLQVLSLGTSNAESFGLMQELRKKLWEQEGFVNPSE
ncbi:SLBB domain-containing protein [Prosthecochloris vibrioformis]|uniref:Sugar transporter n=1 Tax=Prosthecochloris vibrioformis TaxID=1098 RepID=A0A5C4S2P0_PROVB|nr:SLBB domain-containing protein [Prosthecochloris vibrioformis]TNJ37011.1 sugar transporter [Prosthecochloris vibrioformis]